MSRLRAGTSPRSRVLMVMTDTVTAAQASRSLKGKRKPKPTTIRLAQLATLVDAVPSGNRWLHEMKCDGHRVEVPIASGKACADFRNQRGASAAMPFAARPSRCARLSADHLKGDGDDREAFAFPHRKRRRTDEARGDQSVRWVRTRRSTAARPMKAPR